jgi:hypothetical protein
MERAIDEYQRLGRVEVAARPVDLNRLVRDVLALRALDGVALDLVLDAGLPPLHGDEDRSRARSRTWCRTRSRPCRPAGGS